MVTTLDVSAWTPRDGKPPPGPEHHKPRPSVEPAKTAVEALWRRVDVAKQRISRWHRRNQRSLSLAVLSIELSYVFVTVPLRIAFYFNPWAAQHGGNRWTTTLTVYSTLDVLADIASIAKISQLFQTQRNAIAAIAVDAPGTNIRPRQRARRIGFHSKRSQQRSAKEKGTMVAWSLNTIVPTVHFDIRQPLIYEALGMLPLELLAFWLGCNSLHVLRVHKLFRLHRVPDCVAEIKKLHARKKLIQLLEFPGNSLLLKRVAVGLLLCHIVACLYMALAHWQCGLDLLMCSRGIALSRTPQDTTKKTLHYTCWAIEDQLVGASAIRKYSRSIYWACRSMLSVGYYDVAPITDLETAFGIVVQVASALFCTSLIATFLFLFRYLNHRKQEFMTHVDEAKEYMRMSKIPEDVQDMVLDFYTNTWREHSGLSTTEVLQKLPGHVRVRAFGVLITQRIQQVSFLAKESIEFINTLALKMESCVYSPKDWVIENIPDGMFFIVRGTIIIESTSQSQPRFGGQGEHFADFALLYPGRADERARAQTYCELYKLYQRWFHETMEVFYRQDTSMHLERMRSMLNRRDQQQMKMKRLLGKSTGGIVGDSNRTISSSGPGVTNPRVKWNMPGSSFRKRWQLLRIVLLTFVSFEVPFFVVFDTAVFPFGKTPKFSFQSVTSLLGELFFTIDFIFRSRYFAFIEPLSMLSVDDPSYVFEHYKENGMWLDLLSIVPVSTVLEFALGAEWKMSPAFRLVRMLRLRHFQSLIQELAQTRGLSSKVQLAITLVLLVTLSLHVTGCAWFLLARLSMEMSQVDSADIYLTRSGCLRDATLYSNCSWAVFDAYGQIGGGFPVAPTGQGVSPYSPALAYLRSIYWAVVALTTVGYGDIVAFSTQETFFAAFWSFFGGVINYAVVAVMSNLMSSWSAARRAHTEKTNDANIVMARYQVTDKVRSQIRRYYHQQFYMQKVASEAKLLMHLPQHLRQSISLILHAESVKKVPLFMDYGNQRLIHDITGQFRRAVFQHGEYLTHEDTICDEAYVIISGRANVYNKQLGSVPVGALHSGSCYGVATMVLCLNSPTTAIAVGVVEVSAITYQAFISSVEQRFPNDLAALKANAHVQYTAESNALTAVMSNLQGREKLYRLSESCTSMFLTKRRRRGEEFKDHARFYWDILILLLVSYNGLQIPFRIPFLRHPTYRVRVLVVVIDMLCDLVLWIDIMLKLYYFECEAGIQNIIKRQEKNSNYAQHFLKQDLWSQLPLYYIGENFFVMSLCRLPRLIRLRQLSPAIDSLIVRLQQRFAKLGKISAYLQPVKLMLFLIFVSHLVGCIFYGVSVMDSNPRSWINHDIVVVQEGFTTFALYLRSFYWALMTFTLVGTRDIAVLDMLGTLFVGLTCLLCTFIVGVVLGELTDLVLDMDKAKKQLHESESSFEVFAKDHSIPSYLRARVSRYLAFQYAYRKGMDVEVTFRDLPQNLRVQLMMDFYGKTLRELPIASYLSDTQVRGLALRLRSELYIPGDIVIVEGDPGHKVFILKKGSATVLWKSTGATVAKLREGSLFGEVAFFLEATKRIASVQISALSELLVIDRRSWNSVMRSCETSERLKAETAIVQWVRKCLTGYNLMTVEIVNDIKFAALLESKGLSNPIDKRGSSVFRWQSFRKKLTLSKVGKASQAVLGFRVSEWLGSTALRKVYAADDDEKASTRVANLGIKSGMLRIQHQQPSVHRIVQSFSISHDASVRHLTNVHHGLAQTLTLQELEDDCWRRYKVSIFLAGSFSKGASIRDWPEDDDEDSKPRSRRRTMRVNSVCMPPQYNDGTKSEIELLLTKREVISKGSSKRLNFVSKQLNLRSDIQHTAQQSSFKRTQSLPLFNHHYEEMIKKELRASSIKDLANQPKVDNRLDLLVKAQQPAFAFLFRIYTWWQLKKYNAKVRRRERAKARTATRRWSMLQFPSLRREMMMAIRPIEKFCLEDQAQSFFELLSRFHRLWECIVVFIAMFYAISVPLLISFASQTVTRPGESSVDRWVAFSCFMDVLCIVDMVLKYTAFHHIVNVTSGTSETRSVSFGHFFLDLFLAVPFDLLLFLRQFETYTTTRWYYLSLCQLNKTFRVYEAKDASERLAQFLAYDLKLPFRDSSLRYFRSIWAFVLSGHWIACLWYSCGMFTYEHYDASWLGMPKMLALDQFTTLENVTYGRRYLRSAHYAIGSISTIVYGDIGSTNVFETVTEILLNLVAIFVFGVLAGAHSEHLEAKHKHRMRFEQNLVELYYYLKNNEVPRDVRQQLKQYYLKTWLRYHGHDDFEGVQGLSTLLVEDIAQYTLQGFSSAVSIFKSCDECFLRAMLTCLKHIICSPSEQIVRQGDVDRSMYFISHGKVLVEGTGFQLVKEEGDFFGELSLLYGIPRSATCSSLGTSLLYVLEWEAYERILLDYPEYRRVNRRDWVLVSTKLRAGDSRFRSIIDIVSRMENASWVQVDEIIRKAKNLK